MKRTLIFHGHIGLLLATAILSLVIVFSQAERTVAWWAALLLSALIIIGCVLSWIRARAGLRLLIYACVSVQVTACVLYWKQFGSLLDMRVAAFTFGNVIILLGLTSCLLSLKDETVRDTGEGEVGVPHKR